MGKSILKPRGTIISQTVPSDVKGQISENLNKNLRSKPKPITLQSFHWKYGRYIKNHLSPYEQNNLDEYAKMQYFIRDVKWSFAEEVKEDLINNGYALIVCDRKNRKKFEWFKRSDVGRALLRYRQDYKRDPNKSKRACNYLAEHLEEIPYFQNKYDEETIVKGLMAPDSNPLGNTGCTTLIQNMLKFKEVDSKRLIEKVFDTWLVRFIWIDNIWNSLQKMEWLDYGRLKQKFIDEWFWEYVEEHPENFEPKKEK